MKEKRLHSLIVIAPIEAQDDLTTMKTEGLQLVEKTTFRTGDHFWRYDTTGIPKTVMLRMNQVPDLRQWSFNDVNTRPFNLPFKLDLPFNAHVPSIRFRSLCKEEKKPYIGHYDSWCRIRRHKPPKVIETAADVATNKSADGTPTSESRMDVKDWHVMMARSNLRGSGAFSR